MVWHRQLLYIHNKHRHYIHPFTRPRCPRPQTCHSPCTWSWIVSSDAGQLKNSRSRLGTLHNLLILIGILALLADFRFRLGLDLPIGVVGTVGGSVLVEVSGSGGGSSLLVTSCLLGRAVFILECLYCQKVTRATVSYLDRSSTTVDDLVGTPDGGSDL